MLLGRVNRPVSCLPAASKVLEIVICSQLSDYLEGNKLLPNTKIIFLFFLMVIFCCNVGESDIELTARG